jgi:hypothetical protein
MNCHCHNCGEPWTLDGQPGRGETCMKCRADLRVCLNCTSHDPRVAQQCRERRAEPVQKRPRGRRAGTVEKIVRRLKCRRLPANLPSAV